MLSVSISTTLVLCSGCSLFSDPQKTEAIDANKSADTKGGAGGTVNLKENSSAVSVKPLTDPKKLTDVSLEFSLLPEAPVEFLIITYGKSPDALINTKKVSKDSLTLIDATAHTYRYTLKDAGELKPLFVSIITEAGGMKSEPSQPFEVKD